MMASSTTIPMAMVSASSVKLLIEKPRKYMIANVAMIDAGIASPGMIVARTFRKNTKMISTTRIANEQRKAGVVDRVRHEHGPVVRALQLHAERQRPLDVGDRLANVTRDIEEVRR